MSSGDEIQAGRTTTGESTTFLVAAVPTGPTVPFNGTVILDVGPQVGGQTQPQTRIDGIIGRGSARVPREPGEPDGAGVIGHGGLTGGTGMIATGGLGGVGLRAHGGGGAPVPLQVPVEIGGPGVVASGGEIERTPWRLPEDDRRPPGPGLVALAGGPTTSLPAEETAAAGVVGQGGDVVAQTLAEDGTTFVLGSRTVGVGLIGRGGRITGNDGVPGAPVVPSGSGGPGVLGLSGGAEVGVRDAVESLRVQGLGTDVGVAGVARASGVVGIGTGEGSGVTGTAQGQGAGVRATSAGDGPGASASATGDGPGIMAASLRAAQIRVVPIATPTGVPPEAALSGAEPGDLLVLSRVDERGTTIASLYFCTSSTSWTKIA